MEVENDSDDDDFDLDMDDLAYPPTTEFEAVRSIIVGQRDITLERYLCGPGSMLDPRVWPVKSVPQPTIYWDTFSHLVQSAMDELDAEAEAANDGSE